MTKKQNFQGKCCYVCGHQGWKELLIWCTECNQLAIHIYCLGITPGSDEYKYWRCYYCSPESMESSFTNDQTLSIFSNSEYNSDIYQEQPKPLRTIFPKEHHKSSNQEEAAEITRGVVLIVSPTGEAIIQNEIDTSVSIKVSKKVVKKVKGSCNNEKYGEVRRRSERVMQKLNVLHGSKRIHIC